MTSRAARLTFLIGLVAAASFEAAWLFLPTSVVLAAGRRPYVIVGQPSGEPIGQTFRILDDGLESIDVQLWADRPAEVRVHWRVADITGANAVPFYDRSTMVRLPRGRSFHRIAFPPRFPSEKRIYRLQLQPLTADSLDPASPGPAAFGVVASRDDAIADGNIVLGDRQVIDRDLYFSARTSTLFRRFHLRGEHTLPPALRSVAVQLVALVLYNGAMAAFVFEMLFRPRRLESFDRWAAAFRGRTGLEIGGPSHVFSDRGLMPVYAVAEGIDNCNFSRQTVWAQAMEEGQTFVYDRRHQPGRQYIHEATALQTVRDGQYDFVLASHAIEHIANPLRALREWSRVLKPGGALVLVVPHREGTFDHRRPITTLDHLIDDDRRGTGEDDLTHLPEILALHDLAMDPPAGDAAAFKARSERNLENRCLHHHVFDTALVVEMTHRAGFEIRAVEPVRPYHIFVVAQKLAEDRTPDNAGFRGPTARWRAASPFLLDRG